MSAGQGSTRVTTLDKVFNPDQHKYEVPCKRINDGDDLTFFFASTAYRDLTIWLLQLTRAMFPTRDESGKITACDLNARSALAPQIMAVRNLLDDLVNLIEQAPPDTGPRRFGNVAFRKWYQLAEENASSLLRKHLGSLLPALLMEGSGETTLLDELNVYLLGSFGSSQRLDYGTGHELSFLAFLACLWKLGVFNSGDEQAIIAGAVQPYLILMRKLILTYTLEPAGSHGVWGLDDHSFIPYIFGSAQLGPAISTTDTTSPLPTEGSLQGAPSPSSVTNKTMVSDFKKRNMYFSAIQFIYDVKTGPFWEHSPVLYDISGIKDGWGKINKGMLKMYAAEVLGKFPVVQHFPFGSLFPWERDPEARELAASMHVRQQPPQSKDVPPMPTTAAVGTAAPWARPGATVMPQMQASTGMPTTRGPWASTSASDRQNLTNVQGMPEPPSAHSPSSRPSNTGTMAPTPAPWANNTNTRDLPATKAPWARREGGR
ncbi:Putative phosphotyrosyl phosphatase activator, PTPA, PTPA superfamily [Septoria linicola]|uniref:Serine/threonine-protein phosphatase 2A activator n=1 Tax=Septoria linicola TaxID=215465 RepID=A0A9Q9AMA6_9PEZI|nr:putative phosphotyrosyl phosphatase activator, PTPA, PTPA superfamily [Septoria linicola]USW48627.1 Putative phosphotyrosyl phosphatase activator, PTPA, PTPA superfamily [Septoria linicola]